jgi:protein involved in ribonucleotide reduction
VKSIVMKLQLPNIEIHESLVLTQPFLLFTYTDGLGHVPHVVETFMKHNYQNCRGVIASGNSNFGNEVFCKSATILSEQYHLPIVRKIELRGFQHDIEAIQMFYENEFNLEAAT